MLWKSNCFFYFLFFLFFGFQLWDYLYLWPFLSGLNTYNLNITKMWFIKILSFLKMVSLLTEWRIPKTTVCGIKVGYIKLFWSTPLSPTINIYPIHKIGENVFRHINCKKKRTQWRWFYSNSTKIFWRNRTLFKILNWKDGKNSWTFN